MKMKIHSFPLEMKISQSEPLLPLVDKGSQPTRSCCLLLIGIAREDRSTTSFLGGTDKTSPPEGVLQCERRLKNMAMFRPLLSRSLGATGLRYGNYIHHPFSVGAPLSTAIIGSRPLPSPAAKLFSTVPNEIETTHKYEDFSKMTNEELANTSTIPGWDLIHSPPRTFPRGALVGKVVSTRMDKTINVAVDRYRIVPKIRKRMRYTRKFFAHDEKEVANMGDLVMITPCHRMSKHKHFMLREIIRPKGQL